MSPIKDEFLASYWKQNLKKNNKKLKSAFKLSIEDPIWLPFVKSSEIFFEGLLVIAINKIQYFCYN